MKEKDEVGMKAWFVFMKLIIYMLLQKNWIDELRRIIYELCIN